MGKFVYLLPIFFYWIPKIESHGGTSYPPSRQWICAGGASPNLNIWWNGQNGPNICKPASHTPYGYDLNHAITNWSGVGQGGADGRKDSAAYQEDPRKPHYTVMGDNLDSKICSGNMPAFGGLDNPIFATDQGGYPDDGRFPNPYPTEISNGLLTMQYTTTASHRTTPTGYVDTYITKNNIDIQNKVLTWKDLEDRPICSWTPETYPTAMQQSGINNGVENIDCEIPASKSGQHVLFQVWQRHDSPEAFYSCSDVIIKSSQGNDPVTHDTPTVKPTTFPVGTSPADTETTASVTDSNCQAPNHRNLLTLAGQIYSQNTGLCFIYAKKKVILAESKEFCMKLTSDSIFAIQNYNQILSVKTNKCLKVEVGKNLSAPMYKIGLATCSSKKLDQSFSYNPESGRVHSFLNQDYCLGFSQKQELALFLCTGLDPNDDHFRNMVFGFLKV